jgi:enoyl-[acyl-carrier-protein] reductase (NADH)
MHGVAPLAREVEIGDVGLSAFLVSDAAQAITGDVQADGGYHIRRETGRRYARLMQL